MRTKGTAGPSGMDAEIWKRVICSNNFKNEANELREEIAQLARNLASKHYDSSLIQAYTSCRLIPLNKNPGVRPIGVGEVLRRIIDKAPCFQLN